MTHASNHCSASNRLSSHIYRILIVTLVTIVPIWQGCQEDSSQWFVGCTDTGPMLHECVPLTGSAGAFSEPPATPSPPAWLMVEDSGSFHPLLRGILGLWDLWPKANLVCPLSLSPPPFPPVWVSPSWKWRATWSCPMVERAGSSCARATCPLNSLPVSGGGRGHGATDLCEETVGCERLLGSEPGHP